MTNKEKVMNLLNSDSEWEAILDRSEWKKDEIALDASNAENWLDLYDGEWEIESIWEDRKAIYLICK